MFTTAIRLFAILLLPTGSTTVNVDVIELNHVYSATESRDEFGRVKYGCNFVASYFLFWSEYPSGLHIRDWVKADHRCVLDRDTLTVVAKQRVFQIRGKSVREITSLSDRERDDQVALPIARRQPIEGLRK